MKRYIRTKDGRIVDLKQGWSVSTLYDGTNILKQHYQRSVYHQKGDLISVSTESFTTFDILKESNSIEKLCDEYIVVRKASLIDTNVSLKLAKEYAKCDMKVYGTIWIDGKGLICVAEFDKDGKVCLIQQ